VIPANRDKPARLASQVPQVQTARMVRMVRMAGVGHLAPRVLPVQQERMGPMVQPAATARPEGTLLHPKLLR
jgi:hypothetical protein